MKNVSMTFKILTLLLVFTFGMFNAQPAAAADEIEIEFTGKVLAVDAVAGVLSVETSDGQTFEVKPVDPLFDLSGFAVDDLVEVEGTLNVDGTVSAYKIELEELDPVEVEFTGVVTAIDEAAGSLVVDTGAGSLTVFPTADDFDFTAIEVGDTVKVKGVLKEDGSVAAYKVEVIAEGVVKIKFCGTLTAVDAAAGSLTVETTDGRTFTVFPTAEDFDFAALETGVKLCVAGYLDPDGSVEAFRVKLADEDDDDEDDKNEGYYCRQSEDQHPFGARLAERYGVEYEMIQAWFCDGMGWGQIMLALHTADVKDGDPAMFETYLEMRQDGQGWGNIWKDLGFVGKPKDTVSPNDADESGKPDKLEKPAKPDKPEKPAKPEKPNKPNKK